MNWTTVFDSYPNATEIFVVDGMPFLKESDADSHARTTGKKVEKVLRPAAEGKPETAPPKANKK